MKLNTRDGLKKMRNKETAAAVRKCVRMFDVSRCVRIWIFSSLPYEQNKKKEIKKNDRENFVIMITNSSLSFPSRLFFSIITYQFRYER
jgi:hypothetical protein